MKSVTMSLLVASQHYTFWSKILEKEKARTSAKQWLGDLTKWTEIMLLEIVQSAEDHNAYTLFTKSPTFIKEHGISTYLEYCFI